MAVYLALAYCEQGRLDEARSLYEPLAARGFDLPEDPTWLLFSQLSAEIVRHLEDASGAAVLYRRLLPFAPVFVMAGGTSFGVTEHHLAVLAAAAGQLDEADARFASVAATHERIDAPAWLARTRVEWARALLARGGAGDAERARGMLIAAQATAERLGLGMVTNRVRALSAGS